MFRPISSFAGVSVAVLGVSTFLGAPAASAPTDSSLEQHRAQQREAVTVMELLQTHHYSDRTFQEVSASELLDAYLKALDPNRLFFTAADVKFWHTRFDRSLKSVYLLRGDLGPAVEIYDRLLKRALARIHWLEQRLASHADISAAQAWEADRSKADWPKDDAEVEALWSGWLKHGVVRAMALGADRDLAADLVRGRLSRWRKSLERREPDEIREVFLNSIAQAFDPHSGYFGAASATRLENKLASGAVMLGLEFEFIQGKLRVQSIAPGSRVEQEGRIERGDEVVSISRVGGDAVYPTTGSIEAALAKLNAPMGTRFHLECRRGDEPPIQQELETEWLSVPDHRASGRLLTLTIHGGAKVGVVRLPAFYGSGTREDGPRAEDDVRELLADFETRGVVGIILDLRQNGGGLIDQAARLSGLFLGGGPVLLTRGSGPQVDVLSDDDGSVQYAGPLVILTSSQSASASEALAGVLQSCGRAVVVGEETTFGKGSVQEYLDLAPIGQKVGVSERFPWGKMRLTRRLYHLPDGSSLQRVGVVPDIVVEMARPRSARLEGELPHSLPNTRLERPGGDRPKVVSPLADSVRAELVDAHRRRAATRPEFAHWHDLIKLWNETENEGAGSTELTDLLASFQSQFQLYEDKARELVQVLDGEPLQVERVEVKDIAEIRQKQRNAFTARGIEAGGTLAGRTMAAITYLKEGEDIIPVDLRSVEYDPVFFKVQELTEVWNAATGGSATETEMGGLVASLAMEQDAHDVWTALPGLFSRRMGLVADDERLLAGMQAVCLRIAELHRAREHRRDRLDLPLREASRVVVEWARTGSPASP